MSDTVELTLGHSPDPDDAFMFWALAKGKLDTGPYRFTHVLQDIQTLNDRARRGELDITAISVHAYAHVCDKYALLPSGASMGDGYGPLVVAPREIAPARLAGLTIAVPGLLTSAYLELRLAIGEFTPVVVPFDEILPRVKAGEFPAGLLIHEGQLTYGGEGLHCCLDLGVWWRDLTGGLPLPLGANAIHKRHAPARRREISDLLTASIRLGLANREEALAHALGWGRGLDTGLGDRFVGMYVNDWTLDYGDRGRAAIRELLDRGHRAGLVPAVDKLEFVG
jgi:1,4-dihydroxy-6-naphthoate synthase